MSDKKYPEEIKIETAERVLRQKQVAEFDAKIEEFEANFDKLVSNSNELESIAKAMKKETLGMVMSLKKLQETIWRLNDPDLKNED